MEHEINIITGRQREILSGIRKNQFSSEFFKDNPTLKGEFDELEERRRILVRRNLNNLRQEKIG